MTISQFIMLFFIIVVTSIITLIFCVKVLFPRFMKMQKTTDERFTDAVDAAYAKRESHIRRRKV